MRGLTGGLLLALSLSLLAAPARGDAGDIAIELFAQGKQLMSAGDYAGARTRLAESVRLEPKVGTLASLAVCEEHLSHLAEAHARWEQARALAVQTNDPRKTLAESELARVDKLVPKLSLELHGDSPQGLRITTDDVEVGVGVLGTPLPVNPGVHSISATAPGKRSWSTTVRTEADGKVTVVPVGPLEDAPQAAAQPPPVPDATANHGAGQATHPPVVVERAEKPPSEAGGGWGAQRVTALVVGGVGVAGLVVGGVFGIRAIDLKNQRSQFCDANNLCNSEQGVSLDHDARTAATVSTVSMIAGGVLAAGGIVLVLTAPGKAAPAVTVGAAMQSDAAQLTVAGLW
jgi:hypothetical protein